MSTAFDAIRRPEWHGCPVFAATWAHVRHWIADPRVEGDDEERLMDLARLLYQARVIKVDNEQLISIERAVSEADPQAMDWLKLPFPTIFVEIHNTQTLVGCLAWERTWEGGQWDEGVIVLPIVLVEGVPHLAGVTRTVARQGKKTGSADRYYLPGLEEFAENDSEYRDSANYALGAALSKTRALVYLLRSVNVDLAPEPLPRQQRRDAERHDRLIPLTIHVRKSTRTSTRSTGQSRDYSHAFERAGNFAHHFELTRQGTPNPLFKKWSAEHPDRAILVNDQLCFRVWRPPHVVGPTDKPFVPKVRDLHRP